jgi:two-component system, OmpR family, response regulator
VDRKRWVLVVDDDDAVRAAVVGLVGLEPDLAAVGTGSADWALRVLAGLRLDAVVVDLVMPGANGLDLIGRLRADPPTRDLPIAVATAVPPAAVMRRAAARVFPVVGKPLDPDELLAAIRDVLDRTPRPAGGAVLDRDGG